MPQNKKDSVFENMLASGSASNWKMLNAATEVGDGPIIPITDTSRNYQLIVEGSGEVSAEVIVFGSMRPNGPWETLITMSASGTDVGSDAGATFRAWPYTYARITSMTDGAEVTLYLKEQK